MKHMDMNNSEFESSCSLFEDPKAAGSDVIGTNKVDTCSKCSDDSNSEPNTNSNNSDGEPHDNNDSNDEPANDNSH